MQGIIVKGIAGFYYVDTVGSGIYECKARGLFRQKKQKPLIGDRVRFEITDEGDAEGNILEILPRKNELLRPACSNIDRVLIIIAPEHPKFSAILLDRILINMEARNLSCAIAVNKADLASEEEREAIRRIYGPAGYPFLFMSMKTGEGTEELTALLKDRTTVITGPSGVGKSSTVNRLMGREAMEVGEISRKLARGKNTTRHAELMHLPFGGYIMDTPGFSVIETGDIPKEELERHFPEFRGHLGKCYYQGCAHHKEPGCAVKEAVESGKVHPERYQNYLTIYSELVEKEKRRYR